MADININPIEIKDLTTGAVNGTGVFDKIMSTIQARLDNEFNANKIKGTDYSKVYLGSIEASMQQSILFLLGKDKAANEAALIEAQILLAETQRDKVLQEIKLLELQEPKIQAEIRAIEAGILKTEADTVLVGKQVEKVDADTDLVRQKIIESYSQVTQIQQQTALIAAQIPKVNAETDLTEQKAINAITEGQVLTVTRDKLSTEILNIQQNTKTSKAQEATELSKIQDTVYGSPVQGVVKAQKDKMQSDKNLIDQKLKTEKAQTVDIIDGSPVGGLSGKQMLVHSKQADGFTRDAEQKLTKIMTDTWSVRASTNDDTDTRFTNLDNASIGEVVNKAKNGIGA